MADTSSSLPETAAPTPPPAELIAGRPARAVQFIVFLVVCIDLFGFGIVLPLLPRYGKDFISSGSLANWEGPILGALLASFSLMQFVFAPIWGMVSDRIGRRPILLMGLLSSVVFYSVFGAASLLGMEGYRELGLVLLFASRIGAGIAGATLGTAQAAIADSTTAAGRSRGMALIGAAFGFGFLFGPVLGFGALWLAPDFAGGPGFLAAGLSLVALVLGLVLLPETRRAGFSTARRHWLDREGLRAAIRTPGIGLLILTSFLSTFAFANFEPTLALLTKSLVLNLTDKYNFLLFAYVGLVLAVAQGGLYRPLAKRVREIAFMVAGSLLLIGGMAGLGVVAGLAGSPDRATFAGVLTWLLVVLAVAVTGFAFITPSVQALISRRSDPERQGAILGVNQSASAIARVLGPAIGVPLYFATPMHYLPYLLGAVVFAIVLLLCFAIRQMWPAKTP